MSHISLGRSAGVSVHMGGRYATGDLAGYGEAPRQTVEEVLATSHGGNIHDNLVALGIEAIPEMCEALKEGIHPYRLLIVFSEFADPSASPCILEFLESRLADSMGGGVELAGIRALRESGDPSAVPFLAEVQRNEEIYIETRLQVAGAICRLGEGEVVEEARTFIFEFLDETPDAFTNIVNSGVSPRAVADVVAQIRTTESERVLIEHTNHWTPSYVMEEHVIEAVGAMDRLDAAQALADLAANTEAEWHIRIQAAIALTESPRFEEVGVDPLDLLADREEWQDGLHEMHREMLDSLLE